MTARDALRNARLYGILDLGYVAEPALEATTSALIAGGVDILQLRAKSHTVPEILAMGRRVMPLCRAAGIPFIVNDHASVAIGLDADGLHVGQEDGGYDELRVRVGSGMLLGRSTHTLEQARRALQDGFDCIGFGPLFPTPTKLGRPGIGLELIAAVERDVGLKIPVFCIGGIKRGNLGEVIQAGARRVVVVSDLLTAEDVGAAAREIRRKLDDQG